MKQTAFIFAAMLVLVGVPTFFASASPVVAKVQLSVPYVSEVPDGRWIGSWKNACEEASITMVQAYYSGQKKVGVASAKAFMQNLFSIERKLWGSDANSDVARTVKLIADNTDFNGRQVEAPSVAEIKAELDAGRPVIAPINGFTLANKNIPFLASGSGYHMFVIVGYDDAAAEFIVNDTGDTVDGPAHRYGYDRLMAAMHDYVNATQKTNGPVRAIFTFPKLAKTAASHRIYYLSGNTKQYVSQPLVFSQRGWSWSWVNVLSDSFLNGFNDGAVIKAK